MTQPTDERGRDVPRVLGDVRARAAGPTLLCVGGVHGNEPAGVHALVRVIDRLRRDSSGVRGRLVALAGNRCALAARRRFVDRDLNRIFSAERIDIARRHGESSDVELRELRQLAEAIDRVRDETGGRLWFLDLHTTSGPSPAFVVLDDTLPNRRFADAFPAPVVLGLEEELVDTLGNYMSALGVTTLGFEAGQHEDPRAVDRAEAAVWIALETAGVLQRGARPEPIAAYRSLARERNGVPRVVEVRYRHPVVEGDGFRMLPGFSGFDPIEPGQTLAEGRDGPLTATRHGYLLMPLYQDQGEDGFFIVRRVRRFWLPLSALARRLGVERVLHWLPGVSRHHELPRTFVIDRHRARWLARQLFHLLGFKRLGRAGRFLVMTRRSHDREHPG